KTERIPATARATLFRLLDITGIISGVNLAKTNVWPGTDQPFILLFANNQPPDVHPLTRLLCPHYDVDLNGRGEFRLDADTSRIVNPQQSQEKTWLWKAWCLGTSLDVEIIERIMAHTDAVKVSQYWHDNQLAQGQGYMISESRTQRDASHLKGRPNLPARAQRGFTLNTRKLAKFDRDTVYFLGRPGIYTGPLVLVRQSPGTDRRRGFAILASKDVAYVSSYYGYSTAGHKYANRLARYLHLLIHSNLWLHFGLLTSSQFGAERNKLQKPSIDDFPIIPLEKLNSRNQKRIVELSQRLIKSESSVFTDIDKFFCSIYGLGADDRQVINDTLEVGQAYRESSGKRACEPPKLSECASFVEDLQELLAPLIDVATSQLAAVLWFPHGMSTADRTFSAVLFGRAPNTIDEQVYFKSILPLADDTGASQVFMKLDNGGLLIGIRNQYRYWTRTRARLLAAEIIRKHLDTITP
ncbi:MAG: type I restriction endonuclease subunit M, partial [Candidatus Udaeobacter sp.]